MCYVMHSKIPQTE